ncbi:alpha,alpha-trehalose-phosphate synthase (UDP-forming) [Actinotalea caeni]|uniref:alpha,alpha-trehalose-phosphate synthase (UDP-forming) n=1 Tax=Actinotalea caeni TaxID=1348467 RepID=UPI0012E214A3|nr:trehalose-6-phosphate synthase [Actinotalea caeni]
MPSSHADLVVVANRLPVEETTEGTGDDARTTWTRSPGGLVTALAPIMQRTGGTWVGWPGKAGLELDPFTADGIDVHPVALTRQEVKRYYEGFSNATIWPLYHDVIVDPEYHRDWWTSYVQVNTKFAEAAAEAAPKGALVWVQDYQLQLVPRLLRQLRPDLRIGYFHHIPFPPVELFGQLPWRADIVNGLLGADLVGFQRTGDASNFLRAVRRFTEFSTRGSVATIKRRGRPDRYVRAERFPIAIDSAAFEDLAARPEVEKRALEIREELGSPDVLLLGVDRLDYTKGIRHRIKAYGELLADGKLRPPGTTFVQIASPSREHVEEYAELRRQVEVTVGRINGDYSALGRPAIHYLHHSYPAEEMAAMYRAADVMLVTALRDGMNLVAKEYVAARADLDGVLVLSEFTGAADELTQALLVNPHDIEGLKRTILAAIDMPHAERRRRMRAMRKRVMDHDVASWAKMFLDALATTPRTDV